MRNDIYAVLGVDGDGWVGRREMQGDVWPLEVVIEVEEEVLGGSERELEGEGRGDAPGLRVGLEEKRKEDYNILHFDY